MPEDPNPSSSKTQRNRWLNRTVIGMGLTSLLADAGYETATAILPSFLGAIGAPAVALGTIEGVADAVSSFVKLASGWWGDRLGRRKPIVTLGYALSGGMTAVFAVATTWPLVLVGKTVGWFGKGLRGPLRDALLAESIPPQHRGKAFGFHRAGDTIGAIVGPLLAAALLQWLPARAGDETAPFRTIFLLALIPGLGSALAFALLVREERRGPHRARFWTSVRLLPPSFRKYLLALAVFGAGDFSHTLLIFAVTRSLGPTGSSSETFVRTAGVGALLYALRNVFYAAFSYPAGALSDRYDRRSLLAGGYVLGATVMAGFGFVTATSPNIVLFAILMALAGVYIAIEDSLEGALTADLILDERLRGTAYGVRGTVNGLGDLASSVIVGLLWDRVGLPAGFAYAAVMMFAGAALLYRRR
jgi:MFS family permease